MSENNATPISGYLTAAAIGALVGAGVALLYAPCSGRETRKLLADRSRDLKDRAGSAIDSARQFISNRKDDVTEAFEKGKETARAELAHSDT
ncbi:MAG TPA: YtxH domain-containing protein [Verrucomicrobiae bacterium]|nr:YtxH domain-containing protein [Verrucomicrobiae bacterium]